MNTWIKELLIFICKNNTIRKFVKMNSTKRWLVLDAFLRENGIWTYWRNKSIMNNVQLVSWREWIVKTLKWSKAIRLSRKKWILARIKNNYPIKKWKIWQTCFRKWLYQKNLKKGLSKSYLSCSLCTMKAWLSTMS